VSLSEDWPLILIGAFGLAVFGSVGWAGWSDSQRPTIELKKDDWTCSRTEIRTSLMSVVSDKSTIMVPTAQSVCMEYRRVAG